MGSTSLHVGAKHGSVDRGTVTHATFSIDEDEDEGDAGDETHTGPSFEYEGTTERVTHFAAVDPGFAAHRVDVDTAAWRETVTGGSERDGGRGRKS